MDPTQVMVSIENLQILLKTDFNKTGLNKKAGINKKTDFKVTEDFKEMKPHPQDLDSRVIHSLEAKIETLTNLDLKPLQTHYQSSGLLIKLPISVLQIKIP